MARKRRKRGGTGSVIRVKRLSGTGDLRNPNSMGGAALPVLIGGTVTVLTTVGIRSLVEPTAENEAVRTNAPWIGGGVGLLSGLAMYNLTSQPAGVAAMLTSLLVALGQWGLEYSARMGAERALASGTAGVGAVVPEYSLRGLRGGRRGGTGVITMESTASRGYGAGAVGKLGSYGEVVNLAGINPSAFGTPIGGH